MISFISLIVELFLYRFKGNTKCYILANQQLRLVPVIFEFYTNHTTLTFSVNRLQYLSIKDRILRPQDEVT